MNYNQDPWSWVDQQKPVAPLGASLQPSQEQPPPIQVTQDPTMQQLTSMGVGKLAEGAAQGINAGIKAYGATSAPLAATPLAVTPAASTIGTAAAEGLAASGIPGVLPAAASTVPGVLATGAAVPAATTAAGTAAGTAASAGLGTAAAAGGEAALAAMGPVGWAIGAGLLAHKLGIF